MSAFGDWWVKTRNSVEASIESAAIALEPSAQEALVTAAQAGEAAALKVLSSGNITAAGLLDAALGAAKVSLQSSAVSIGEALLQRAVAEQLTPTSTPVAAQAQ